MANPLRLSGLGSGIDTDTLVERLMQVERRPLDQLNSQRARLEQRSSVFTELTTRLNTLQQRITALTQPATLNSKQLTSNVTGPNAPATGTANVEAAVGSFQVWVDALATSTTVQSTAAIGQAVNPSATLSTAGFVIPVTTGTFRINGTAVTVAATDTLNDVITKINTLVSGVTATLVNDANGRPNRLELSSSSSIQVGSGADTSNFLTATRVLSANNVFSGGLYRVTSTANIGATLTTAPLTAARLETALSPTSGSFRINGQTITYNATQDSLSNVISRINASSAGVTAAYDPVTDRIRLTANQTGNASILLEDVTGNFLAATGVLTATQTFGQNAEFRVSTINGGATLTSASNTVSNIVPGVTLNLRQVSPDPVTMTVGQNADATVNAVRDFVTQYNNTMQFLRAQTTFVQATRTSGPFVGDSGLRSIEQNLRTLLTSPADGTMGVYTRLSEIGVSFGRVGSALGTTQDLQLDEAKLREALQQNPTAVQQVFGAMDMTTTLAGGGTGSLASISGNPTSPTQRVSGAYTITTTAAGGISAVFTPTGGVAQPEVSGTITAGGSNSSLIPGLTLTAGGTLTNGTHTITVNVAAKGVAAKVTDYLASITGPGGLFAARRSELDSQSSAMRTRVTEAETRLQRREDQLRRQFTAMESAVGRLRSQQDALTNALMQLNGGQRR